MSKQYFVFLFFTLLIKFQIKSNQDFLEYDIINDYQQDMVRLIKHDRHAYRHDEWKSDLLYLKVVYNKSINSYVEIGYDEIMKSIIVSFRGTKYSNEKGFPDFKNILADLNIGEVDYKELCEKCKVHKGFLNCFQAIKDEVFSHIKELKEKYPSSSIIFSGHSYGGSLAVLASITYYKNISQSFSSMFWNLLGVKEDISLITFGQPRTGNKEFSKYVNENINKNYRITYDKDPIVGLPFKTKNGYYHQGTEVNFVKSNFDKGSYTIKKKFEDETYNSINLFNLKYHSKYWEFIGEKLSKDLTYDVDVNYGEDN